MKLHPVLCKSVRGVRACLLHRPCRLLLLSPPAAAACASGVSEYSKLLLCPSAGDAVSFLGSCRCCRCYCCNISDRPSPKPSSTSGPQLIILIITPHSRLLSALTAQTHGLASPSPSASGPNLFFRSSIRNFVTRRPKSTSEKPHTSTTLYSCKLDSDMNSR